jgi:putative peptide zinc metalloprotease protein
MSAALSPASIPASSAPDTPLPRLRPDLRLSPGPQARDGGPSWSIFDPARNAYFRIGWAAREILARWGLGRVGAVAEAVNRETTLTIDDDDVQDFARFLQINELTAADDKSAIAWLTKRAVVREKSLLSQAVHGYLFFRIPLLRPDRFLTAALPLVEPLFSRTWRRIVMALGLIGLFLASRQWDAFVGGLADMATWESAAALALTVAVIKIVHEFGHAFTAKRYGCPVPTMGVAFLVMWPVLYTDTTHAYRLTSRRRRLEVAGAGIMVELFIAALATFAWALLPPGALRDAMQTAAVVSWIGTLAVNLNPLMRFDGYYLLADALDTPNLQDRAFALGKWRLREALFGLKNHPPEAFDPPLRRILIAYAFAAWVYRFFLFLGIAVLVYHMAFKALGVFLMGVEIVYFIALPIWRELAAWWERRREVGFNRHVLTTFCGLIGVGGLLALPFPWPVKAPAALRPAETFALHAPTAAQVKSLPFADGAEIRAGAALIELASPDLDYEAERTARRIKALEAMIDRESALADSADQIGVLKEELRTAQALAVGVAALQAQLTITAPFDGRLTDLADPLRPGQWVRPEAALGRVASIDRRRVTAFIAADDLSRVEAGASAKFISDDPAAPALPLRLEEIASANADALDAPLLSARLGGPIPTAPIKGRKGAAQERPSAPVYRAVLTPVDQAQAARLPPQTLAGRVFIDAPPLSLIRRGWNAAAAVLIRESGF